LPSKGWKSIAIPEALHKKLEAEAHAQSRSVDNLATKIITEALDMAPRRRSE